MQTRKIALHRFSIIALVLALLVLGSALAVAGDSSAISPQVGKVNYTAVYYLDGSLFGPANNSLTTVTVTTLNGVFMGSSTGAQGNFTNLPFGSYLFSTNSYEGLSGTSTVIANSTSTIVNLTSSTQSTSLHISIYKTKKATVEITPIAYGTSGSVSLKTPQGFVFATGNVNYTDYNITTNLPNGGFYVSTVYGGQTYNTYEASLPTSGQLVVSLSPSTNFGFVTDYSTGNSINNFNIVDLNTSTNTYSVLPFTGGFYQIDSLSAANNVYTLEANGYAPMSITSPANTQANFQLNKSSNNIYYNYALAQNPQYLNLSVNYQVANSTTLPFLGNSSVGSFYWQYQLDGLSTSTAQALLNKYLTNTFGQYTNNAITVDGYNYNASGTYGTLVSEHLSSTGLTATINYTFQNPNIKASDLTTGFQVKLYAQGTQYLPAALNSIYNLTYHVNNVSLSSPANGANTFTSPVSLKPQANSGFLTLDFTTVTAPQITASAIKLYWNNTTPTNYLIASNSTSAAFIVPENMPVSFNLSNAFYNPVTGTNNYQDSISYQWVVNGVSSSVLPGNTGFNYTYATGFNTFGNYTVSVIYESSAGSTNTTTFNVFAYNATPEAYLNVTSGGNTLFSTAKVAGTQNLVVPQSKVVQFSGYYSKLAIPSTTYTAPIIYSWSFPGYTNNAVNVTQTFSTPYISSNAMVVGYLNVSTAVGKIASTQLFIKVNDTTAPSVQVTLQNATHSTIAQPIAGQLTIFSANKSTDKYYPSSDLTYNWSIVYANGTQVPAGSSTYTMVGNNTNLSYIQVQFSSLSSYIVSVKVTNPSNVSAYGNFTTSMVVVSPRLVVQGVYFPITPSQGSETLMYVNVSNNGTVNANSFYIVAIVNGKVVNNQSYGPLPVGTTKQFEFNLTSPSQGSVQVEFEAINSTQPSFFATNGALTVTQSVSPPGYQTPLIAGGVIAIVVIIGFVYYRLSSRTSPKPRDKKQLPAKKSDEKKK